MLQTPPLHVVLVTPEIPPNTGNVARTCAVTGAQLHLIEPLGFAISDRELRRAGLDYWPDLDVQVWPGFDAYVASFPEARRWYCTTKASRRVDRVVYALGDHLIFGPETRGLPDSMIASAGEQAIRIPMRPHQRSLNLSNAVAIVMYTALAGLGFPGME